MTNQLFNQIKDYYSNETPFPGASIIVRKNSVIDYLCIGHYQNNKNSLAIKEETIFDLASISKLYTAFAILKLQNSNLLNIEDKCSDYLEIFNESELRIIDLLTHKANFNIKLSDYRLQYKENLKKFIYNIVPPIVKSDEVTYENITYIYLGKIIEKITGLSLSKYFNNLFMDYSLNETILGSSERKNIDSPPTEYLNNFLVQNITHDETSRLLGGIAGNAGVFSSARDLLKFSDIWLNDISIKNLAFKNYNSKGIYPQGLGWWNRVQGIKNVPSKIFSHSGFTGGIVIVNIENNDIAIILTNRTLNGRDNNKHIEVWKMLVDYLLDN